MPKKAVIRDPMIPQFQPADMYIECCGGPVFVSRVQRGGTSYTPAEIRCSNCMAVYSPRGFVIVQGLGWDNA